MHKQPSREFELQTHLSLLTIVTVLAEIAPSLHAYGSIERLLEGGDPRFRVCQHDSGRVTVAFLNEMTKSRFIDLLKKKFNLEIS